LPRISKKAAPGTGQAHPEASSLEERDSQRRLEQPHVPAEWRLSHMKPYGASELRLLGDGFEATQLTELEHRYNN
jgi:hypothetical protein